jgi:HD-like signal output (HDOD) protein
MSKATEFALKATDSFALPDICVRVRSMLDDDSSSIDDVATLVSLDPSLASKLLRLANSPLFRFRSEVDSLSKAVGIIGGEALYNLIMAETASSAFEHFTQESFNTKRFWLQSIYAGLIAKHLAKLLRLRGSERFFLLGLLHNLGELVVSAKSPELAEKCTHFSESVNPWSLQQKVLVQKYCVSGNFQRSCIFR